MTRKLKKTDLINPYTGLKREKSKSPEKSKERSGLKARATWETDGTTLNMASEFNSTQTVTNTKETGSTTCVGGRELYGLSARKPKSCAERTQETGKATRRTAEGLSSTKTTTDLMAFGKTTNPMAKAGKFMTMETCTKDNESRAKGRDMEF